MLSPQDIATVQPENRSGEKVGVADQKKHCPGHLLRCARSSQQGMVEQVALLLPGE